MSKHLSLIFGITALSLVHAGCGESEAPASGADEVIQQVYEGKLTVAQAQAISPVRLQVVPVGGTVFHFGLDLSQSPPVPFPFQSTVSGVRVWIAELPITRALNIRSDAGGNWRFPAIKIQGTPLRMSFVYERDGYPTTKSQVFEIGDAGITDVAVQFPTTAYFLAAKGQIEQQIGALIGAPYSLKNVLVTTVGKSWASMFSPRLPHGDPGVQVAISPAIQFPASLGPVYFNESVAPDPTLTSTSVDGGVLFGNLAKGSHTITASKAPFSYAPLTFVVQDGIQLYVASPPHATQGTNDAPPPGEQPPVCTGVPPQTPLIFGAPAEPIGTFSFGLFTYAGAGLTPPVATPTISPIDGSMQSVAVTANLVTTDPTQAFAGFGFGFGNPSCLDASAFTGVRFTVAGDLGTCGLQLSLTPSENNSVAFGPFGSCTGTACFGPFSPPLGVGTQVVHFSDMTGGMPLPGLDAAALNDISWNLIVPSDGVTAPCVANFTVSDVSFVTD